MGYILFAVVMLLATLGSAALVWATAGWDSPSSWIMAFLVAVQVVILVFQVVTNT